MIVTGRESSGKSCGCFQHIHRSLHHGRLLTAEFLGWRKSDDKPVVACPCCKTKVAVDYGWQKAEHIAESGFVINDVPGGIRTQEVHSFLLPRFPRG